MVTLGKLSVKDFFIYCFVQTLGAIVGSAGAYALYYGTCYGMNLGYPINPARDLGPRIFSLFIYGSQVFREDV
uniref:Aquaporin n=1 Tax=Heterorhabditis bacteriophora TaxID=37862 RepID=A0A1I7XPI6_HETBA